MADYIVILGLFTVGILRLTCFVRRMKLVDVIESTPKIFFVTPRLSYWIVLGCALLSFVMKLELHRLSIIELAMGMMFLTWWPIIIHVLIRPRNLSMGGTGS